MEHLRNRRTEDIAVEQTYLVAKTCQSDSEVGCNGTLAHAALARADGDDVLHLRQQLAHFRARLREEFGLDCHLHVFRHVIVDGSLSRLDSRLHERVGIAWEDECKLHFHAVDAHIVGKHIAFYEVFLCTCVYYCCECVSNEFRI